MICNACADAADQKKIEGHAFCVGNHCFCQHRIDAVIIKKEENE